MSLDKALVTDLFSKVNSKEPLVHHITNPVTVNDCANSTLAIGGAPVMATSIEEVAEMVSLANALVINFGTIDLPTYEAMVVAGQTANEKGIPVILDPVGVGATTFRNERVADYLKKVTVSIVRGNATEIHALVGGESVTRGVDAGDITGISKTEIALQAARKLQAIIVMSGEEDVISSTTRQVVVESGHVWLTKVSGTGCMTASLIGCFAGVTKDYFHAAVAGISTMSLAGEYAKRTIRGTEGMGTYRVRLIDEIFRMDGERWRKGVRLKSKQIMNCI